MLDLFLVATLGFLGSFGHCAGMCGPLAVAFSLSHSSESEGQVAKQKQSGIWFHLWLNLGRVASYALIGIGLGALGSVLVAGGQLAGIGSDFRRGMAIVTGLLLIWFGLHQIHPNFLPNFPFFHPLQQGHQRLSHAMLKLGRQNHAFVPLSLGLCWGLIPCGFLYAAQLKAAETGSITQGAVTMLAFGLGTFPTMVGVGVTASKLSRDRRSQLFRLGGWVTLVIGILTLLRTGDTHADYTGHASLFCLMLALIARPISPLWMQPLRYRRALGVGAFILAMTHTLHMMEHSLNWHLEALWFLLPLHQWGMLGGLLALVFMLPAAVTSFDRFQKNWGKRWRQLHLLSVPALILGVFHAICLGSHYLGNLDTSPQTLFRVGLLGILTLGVLVVRSRLFWSMFSLEKFYAPPPSR